VEPDRWAGGDGWRDGNPAVQAWMPFRVQLLVDQLSDVQTASTHPAASTVRWPFEGTLEEPRCEVLGFTETDVLVRAFNTVGVEDSGGWALQGEYLMAAGTPDTLFRVTLTVLQPGEQDSCETIGF
jgi:hypothetical protein